MPLFTQRHPRKIEDLMDDPNFRFNVYRHLGASEMVAHWLIQQEDPMAKSFGERLMSINAWFYIEGPRTKIGVSESGAMTRTDPWEE